MKHLPPTPANIGRQNLNSVALFTKRTVRYSGAMDPIKSQALLVDLSSLISVRPTFTFAISLLLISSLVTDAVCMAGTCQDASDTRYFITHDSYTLLSPLFVEDETERTTLPQVKRAPEKFIFVNSGSTNLALQPTFNSSLALHRNLSMLVLFRLRV